MISYQSEGAEPERLMASLSVGPGARHGQIILLLLLLLPPPVREVWYNYNKAGPAAMSLL